MAVVPPAGRPNYCLSCLHLLERAALPFALCVRLDSRIGREQKNKFGCLANKRFWWRVQPSRIFDSVQECGEKDPPWGTRLPTNMLDMRLLCFSPLNIGSPRCFLFPPPHKCVSIYVWNASQRSLVKGCTLLLYDILGFTAPYARD